MCRLGLIFATILLRRITRPLTEVVRAAEKLAEGERIEVQVAADRELSELVAAFNKMSARARELVDRFNVKTPRLETPLKNLSGGNIQKLILARELSREPKVLIASQPTRGVDIGATEYIHQRLLEQRDAGMAILLISEDLDEIQELSDRIAVMYEGRIVGIVDRGAATSEQLGLLMAGVVKENS